jgi:hypothetical protein
MASKVVQLMFRLRKTRNEGCRAKSRKAQFKLWEGRRIMKSIGLIVSLLGLVGSLELSIVHLWGAEGVISRVSVPESKYCRLRFPAIREDTLYSARPVLKDPSDGDIVDYYGPCDYDPAGKEEVARQKAELRRDRHNDNS